jgi:hypothetical protein
VRLRRYHGDLQALIESVLTFIGLHAATRSFAGIGSVKHLQ